MMGSRRRLAGWGGMNFSISGGSIGLVGGWILFGALILAFAVVVSIVVRLVRGRDDEADGTDEPARRPPEDDLL